MRYECKLWWEHLTEKEKELLIEMLFGMDLEAFEYRGVILNKKTGKYEKKK
jgi:hypothetical protein